MRNLNLRLRPEATFTSRTVVSPSLRLFLCRLNSTGYTLHQSNIPSPGLADVHIDLVWLGAQGVGKQKFRIPASHSGAAQQLSHSLTLPAKYLHSGALMLRLKPQASETVSSDEVHSFGSIELSFAEWTPTCNRHCKTKPRPEALKVESGSLRPHLEDAL